MKGKLTLMAKRELISKFKEEYKRASKTQKSKILDNFVAATGYNRKYAIGLLNNHRSVPKKKRRKRLSKYTKESTNALVKIWKFTNMMNSKALCSCIKIWLDKLIEFDEIEVDDFVYNQLLSMSSATIDRILKPTRDKMNLKIKGKSTTKPGDMLKNSIKIRKAGDEVERKPGFVEVDTVAHCGNTLAGEFARSLTITDVFTGWTEDVAIRNNAHANILEGLNTLEQRIPFKLEGFDCDNGSEFINHDVVKWISDRDLYMTRSRPYRKNDNAHVEQKNYDFVRRNAFYYRYDTQIERDLLNEL
jgi:hypothetical protein